MAGKRTGSRVQTGTCVEWRRRSDAREHLAADERDLAWRGRDAIGNDGEKIGTLGEIYLDQQTGEPEWALVNTGLLGTQSNFVPLAGASPSGEAVQVPFSKQPMKDAPGVSPDGELSQQEEAELYRHYGLDYSESRSGSGLPEGGAAGGRATDDAMTRSEEELRVGTVREPAGRVRLGKWVETEEVQQTVPGRREKARLEREPITEGNVDEAMSGPEITESEHEVAPRGAAGGREAHRAEGARPAREGRRGRRGDHPRGGAQGAHRGGGRPRAVADVELPLLRGQRLARRRAPAVGGGPAVAAFRHAAARSCLRGRG
jgi:uncharacterized protein DUF2382/PRC-barrel domain protein